MVEYASVTSKTATQPLDARYAALAHPIRRQILEELRTGERRVSDLASSYAVSLNAVSKHIKVLEGAGLIERAVHGREHVLSLHPESLQAPADYLETYRALWNASVDRLEALMRERRNTPADDAPKRGSER